MDIETRDHIRRVQEAPRCVSHQRTGIQANRPMLKLHHESNIPAGVRKCFMF